MVWLKYTRWLYEVQKKIIIIIIELTAKFTRLSTMEELNLYLLYLFLKIEFVLLYLILIWLFSFFLNLYSLFVILLLCLSGSFEFTCSIVGSSPGIVPVNEVLIAWHFMTIFMHNLLWIIIIIIYCCLSCWSVFH